MGVTVTADKDILVLYRMLTEPGRWMIFIHQGHIVKVTKLPPEQPADALLTKSETVLKSE